MKKREHRVKHAWVGYETVFDLVFQQDVKKGCIKTLVLDDEMPKDAEITGCFSDPTRDGIIFVLWSKEFPIVENGDCVEFVNQPWVKIKDFISIEEVEHRIKQK